MKNKKVIGVSLLFVMFFVACSKETAIKVDEKVQNLLCLEGSMIVGNSSKIYYTVPNLYYFNKYEKGMVGMSYGNKKHEIYKEGGSQLFAIDNNIFISISKDPALDNFDATTYVISGKNNEIIHFFQGSVVYISYQNKLVFYIHNNYENREKGGLYCCDPEGKNERKLVDGGFDYIGRDGEDLYFQSVLNDEVDIVTYKIKENKVKTISKEKYIEGMKITDFKVTNGVVNYIYGHYEGQLGNFNGKIVSIPLKGEKKEIKYETMEPQFYIQNKKVYFCVYKDDRKMKCCVTLELNSESETEFDDILLCKEEMDTYDTYKNVNCSTKINVLTRSGKEVKIYEDKLKKMFKTDNSKAYIEIRRMDVYENYIYMNIELWESKAGNKELFVDRKLLELNLEDNTLEEIID